MIRATAQALVAVILLLFALAWIEQMDAMNEPTEWSQQ